MIRWTLKWALCQTKENPCKKKHWAILDTNEIKILRSNVAYNKLQFFRYIDLNKKSTFVLVYYPLLWTVRLSESIKLIVWMVTDKRPLVCRYASCINSCHLFLSNSHTLVIFRKVHSGGGPNCYLVVVTALTFFRMHKKSNFPADTTFDQRLNPCYRYV